MANKNHGFVGSFIKILMVILFMVIGVTLIVLNSICLSKGNDHFSEEGYGWIPILNVVLGCLLLTSPFFLSNKRTGLAKAFRIIMIILFVLMGLLLISSASYAIYVGFHADFKVVQILSIVFGCLLLTSPLFLSKSVMGTATTTKKKK